MDMENCMFDMTESELSALRPLRTLNRVMAALLLCAAASSHAQIVGLGNNPPPLPQCPFPDAALQWLCVLDTSAKVVGVVGEYQKVRIARQPWQPGILPGNTGPGLLVGEGASLLLNSTIAVSADLVVGDNFGTAGGLFVTKGGKVDINVPTAGAGSGGLIVGAFAAPAGYSGPSTVMQITDGGAVTVNKPGGLGFVASAVAVGYGAGANSNLYLDGGIDGFGNAAGGAKLITTGNLSIGREGVGAVTVFRNANVEANVLYMSTIGLQGESSLFIGHQSTVRASGVFAGIGLNPITSLPDATVAQHGTAYVDVHNASSSLLSILTLGEGGNLSGSGFISGLINWGGHVRPGNSPGTLNIGSGGYTDVGGHLVIEVGNSGIDKLLVDGAVSLTDTDIEFNFIEGFAPQAGFSFDFIDATTDMVDMHNLHFSVRGLAPGFRFDVTPGADGRLSFTAVNAGVALDAPTTPALLALGGLLMGWVQRRKVAAAARSRPTTPAGKW